MKKIITIENLLCLLVLSTPLYLAKVSFFGIPSNVFELFGIFLFIICIVLQRKTLLNELKRFPKILFVSILLVLLGVFLSTLYNNNYRAGFGILKGWFMLPIIFSFFIYVSAKSVKAVEKFFISICCSSAIVGCIAIVYKLSGATTYDGRLKAFYLSPNHLAMYLSCGLFFCFYFFLKALSQKNKKRAALSLALLAITATPLYFTFSYGAWAATSFTLILAAMTAIPRKKLLSCALLVFLVVFAFFSQAGSEKFNTLKNFSERSSLASRIMIWKASLLMLEQSPIVGIGPGNFQDTYLSLQKFFPPYLEWAVPQPHNIFLAFWLQSGIMGLAGFFLIFLYLIKSILKIYRKEALLSVPLLCFFLYTLLHGVIDTPLWKNDLSFLFWACVFLTAAVRNLATKKPDVQTPGA